MSENDETRRRTEGAARGSRAPKKRETEEALRADAIEQGTERPIRAARPRPGPKRMRTAYLELLKLCLCDLAGARTMSVSRTGDTRRRDSQVKSWELSRKELALRARGSDWPFGGLTMVGLQRLDDLQACIEEIVADSIEGDVIEAGTWRGGAAILARATLDSLGANDRTLWVADSFRGLPPPDQEAFPEDSELDLSSVEFLAVSIEEVRNHFARFGLEHGIEFIEGFFADTLPRLRGNSWAIIRLDGDTYEATWVGLESLYPRLSAGGFLIVDDYGLIGECRAAVEDYRREHGITEPIEKIDWNGIRWRRQDEPEPPPDGAVLPSPEPSVPEAAELSRDDQPPTPIPTEREIELQRELRELRRELRRLGREKGSR